MRLPGQASLHILPEDHQVFCPPHAHTPLQPGGALLGDCGGLRGQGRASAARNKQVQPLQPLGMVVQLIAWGGLHALCGGLWALGLPYNE